MWASLIIQMVKNLPAIQETRVQSLGWDDPLEKEMATHSSILAWRIPSTEEPGGLQSKESQRIGHNWVTFTFFFTMWKRKQKGPLSQPWWTPTRGCRGACGYRAQLDNNNTTTGRFPQRFILNCGGSLHWVLTQVMATHTFRLEGSTEGKWAEFRNIHNIQQTFNIVGNPGSFPPSHIQEVNVKTAWSGWWNPVVEGVAMPTGFS